MDRTPRRGQGSALSASLHGSIPAGKSDTVAYCSAVTTVGLGLIRSRHTRRAASSHTHIHAPHDEEPVGMLLQQPATCAAVIVALIKL